MLAGGVASTGRVQATAMLMGVPREERPGRVYFHRACFPGHGVQKTQVLGAAAQNGPLEARGLGNDGE